MRFDKDMTQVVKGVAIIMMMLLHCYGVDGNYDVAVDASHAPLAGPFRSAFKICVGIFTFMVGYGYAFSKTKDLRYSLQHIKKLLIPFWTILFVFTLPFCWSAFWTSGPATMLMNLVGIDSTFNWYSWFVYFFIYAMAVLPFVARFIDRRPLCNTAIAIAVAFLLEVAVHSIPGCLENKPLLALFNCLMMTPGMTFGYLFAHERYYERMEIKIPSKALVVALSLLLIVVVLAVRYFGHAAFGFNFDFVYAALTIGAVVTIFNHVEAQWLRNALQALGRVSVYMWFFHALFFTKDVRWFYQPAITIFDDLNLIVLWAIALTFAASWLIKQIVDFIMSKMP